MIELDTGDKTLLHRGIEKLNAANEIMRFLSDYFRDKYGLTPEHQITPDGQIITSVGVSGLPQQIGNGNASVDMSVLQDQVAVRDETSGDS